MSAGVSVGGSAQGVGMTTIQRGVTTRKIDPDDPKWIIEPWPEPCPEWCTAHPGDKYHGRHREIPADRPAGAAQVRYHPGPTFGEVSIEGIETLPGAGSCRPSANVSTRTYRMTPTELRQLAADVIAAADWLESTR